MADNAVLACLLELPAASAGFESHFCPSGY
jgi:hypothetical protein